MEVVRFVVDFFTNITCGIGLLAVVSPMAQDVIGMAPPEAASFVGIIGVVNGGGRIFWSTVSDWIGRGVTYMIFFAFEVFAFYRLSDITDSFVFQFLVLAVISCYGGGFSCMPAFLSDILVSANWRLSMEAFLQPGGLRG